MLKPILLFVVTANFVIVSYADNTEAESKTQTKKTEWGSTLMINLTYNSTSTDGNSNSISCGGDPNAKQGCDAECRKHCPTKEPLKCSCPKQNSCECKEGYLYDSTIYKCVEPKNCQQGGKVSSGDNSNASSSQMSSSNASKKRCRRKCKFNERYVKCPATVCEPKRCSDLESPASCVKLPKCRKCPVEPGCICKKGYVWDDDEMCIPVEECQMMHKTTMMTVMQTTMTPVMETTITPVMETTMTPVMQTTMSSTTTTAMSNATTWCHTEVKSPTPLTECDKVLDTFHEGITLYTAKILYELLIANPDKNIAISPATTMSIVGQMAMYTDGSSNQELLSVLNLRNKEEVRCAFMEFRDKIVTAENHVYFKLLAKIYAKMEPALSEKFKQDTKNIFLAEAQNVNFSNPYQTTDDINNYIEKGTESHIMELVSPSMFKPIPSLYLASAQYFNLNMRQLFKPSDITERIFNTGSKLIMVPTMFRKDIFEFSDNFTLQAKMVKIPIQDSKYSLLVVLPYYPHLLNDLVKKLQNPEIFQSVLNLYGSHAAIVNLYLPVINVKFSTDLKGILKKTNITKVFDPETSGITDVMNKVEPVYVTEGRLKASFETTGLETEAVPSYSELKKKSGESGILHEHIVRVDHSFVFYILFKSTPILCGVMMQ